MSFSRRAVRAQRKLPGFPEIASFIQRFYECIEGLRFGAECESAERRVASIDALDSSGYEVGEVGWYLINGLDRAVAVG